MRKIKKILLYLIIIISISKVYAYDEVVENVANSFNIKEYLKTFEDYISENNISKIDVNNLYEQLISGQGIEYSNIADVIFKICIEQFRLSLSSVLSIFIILIILALIKNLELDKNSDVVKITKLVILISISTILLKNYLDVVSMFKNIINTLSYIMQIVSTFLLGILVASGKATSMGVIQPMLLFISNFICVVTEYLIIPFFTISVALNIISRISENIKIDNLSNMFRKSSIYIFSAIIAIFVFILSFETSISKSIDNLYFKTAQSALSNFVPVVGDFLSDSLNTILGTTQLIGKVGGAIALIVTALVVSIPIIKLIAIILLYNILLAISEPINEDKDIENFLKGFIAIYKDMLGILIGIMVLFVMSTGIIMAIINNIGG